MKDEMKRENNPSKVYKEELTNRDGKDMLDSDLEGKARDRAKIDKSIAGVGQKMDSIYPDDLHEPDGLDPDDEMEEKG